MPAKASAPTKQKIWDTLSHVTVKPWLKQRGNFSYLPWADAWALLMSEFPEAEFHEGEFQHANGTTLDAQFYPDETARVTVSVTIGEHTLSMWLPVMDMRNNAIKNPNARDISDAKARCLVKALAMFGLGHSVYAGAVDEVHDEPAPHAIARAVPEPPAPKKVAAKANGNAKLSKEQRAQVGKAAIERAIVLNLKDTFVKQIGGDAVKALGFNKSEDVPADQLDALLARIKAWGLPKTSATPPATEEIF
jgi:hypothetical protein